MTIARSLFLVSLPPLPISRRMQLSPNRQS